MFQTGTSLRTNASERLFLCVRDVVSGKELSGRYLGSFSESGAGNHVLRVQNPADALVVLTGDTRGDKKLQTGAVSTNGCPCVFPGRRGFRWTPSVYETRRVRDSSLGVPWNSQLHDVNWGELADTRKSSKPARGPPELGCIPALCIGPPRRACVIRARGGWGQYEIRQVVK